MHSNKNTLFDHLVGRGKQRRWYREPEGARRLKIDREFKLDGPHHRQKTWLSYGRHRCRAWAIGIETLAHQPPIVTNWLTRGRQRIASRQRDQLLTWKTVKLPSVVKFGWLR